MAAIVSECYNIHKSIIFHSKPTDASVYVTFASYCTA